MAASALGNLPIWIDDSPGLSLLELRSKVRWGNVEFDGDISKDSPGSDLIRELLLDDEPGPLFLLAWGGQSTIARALKSIEDEFEGTAAWPEIQAKV